MANLAQRPGTFRAVALAVVLAVGIGCTASAQNPVTETETMKQLNTTTYWLGNNFGSAAQDGFERGHVHMKMCVNDIFAYGDRVFLNGTWDEGHTHIAVFDSAGAFKGYAGQGIHNGWLEGAYAITADDRHVYAGGIIHDADPGTPQGVSVFFIVLRLDHDGKPAPFEGGKTKSRCALILSKEPLDFTGPYPMGYKELNKPAGLAVTADTLWVSDPRSGKIKAFAKADLKEQPDRHIAMKDPGWLAVDPQGNLWVTDRASRQVVQFAPDGKPTGRRITDAKVPTDIAFDREGNMLVCDNAFDRQHIRVYDPSGKLLRTFGRPAYGLMGDDTFFGLTGVSVAQDGSLYVATNGILNSDYHDFAHYRVGKGAELFRYKPDGSLDWRMASTEFVHNGAVDPDRDTDFYTTENRFELDYTKPTTPGVNPGSWKLVSYTLDPVKYPDDLRNHRAVKIAQVQRVKGTKLLVVWSDWAMDQRMIYRFDGEIAVPAAMVSSNPNYVHPVKNVRWPKDAPWKPFLWVDRNGDGQMDASEFQELADAWNLNNITPDGTIWGVTHRGTVGVFRLPLRGFSDKGVPLYDAADVVKGGFPEADIERLTRLAVLPGTDSAIVGILTKKDFKDRPKDAQQEAGYAGSEIRRYDHWSALFDGRPETAPKRAWTIKGGPGYPYRMGTAETFDHSQRYDKARPVALHAACPDYFFLAYDGRSRLAKQGEPPTTYPDVQVFRTVDGTNVGYLTPTEEVNTRGGMLDIGQGSISTHRRANGDYLVFLEDCRAGKIMYYIWKPSEK